MTLILTVKEDAPGYSRPTPKKIENPYDKFFKETFSHVEVAQSFLHNYLPPDVMETLDTERLELEKDSFKTRNCKRAFPICFLALISKQKRICLLFV